MHITFHFEITGFRILYLWWVPSLVRDFGKSQRHEIFLETSNNVCYMIDNLFLSIALKTSLLSSISFTQLFSNSLIRESSLCFWRNGTKESYDTNSIMRTRVLTCTALWDDGQIPRQCEIKSGCMSHRGPPNF